MPIRGILLVSFLVASLPVCFVRPFYGILLWAVVAFLNPQAYVWNSVFSFPWAMVVAIPTLAGFLIFSRGWMDRLMSREVLLLAVLWIWFTLTTVSSTNTPLFVHHATDTWFRWNFVSKILLMTVVTIAVVDSFARLRMLILVIASSLGFFVAKAVPFMVVTGASFRLYGPEQSMIADNNDFGLALNMTLPLLMLLAQTESSGWVRRVFWALFAVTIPAIFFTYSRGALVGLVTVMFFMFLQMKQRWILMPVGAFAVMIALLFAPDAWKERMDPSRPDAVDISARQRLNAWTYSWNLATDFPIMGGGFEAFTPNLYQRYAPNPLSVHGPHSIYFGVLAEHGFVGLALYLTLVVSCFATTMKLSRLGRFHGDEVAVQYATMLRFSLLGFLACGAFLGRAYFDYFFTIVACIAILKRICMFEWAESDDADAEPEQQAALGVHA